MMICNNNKIFLILMILASLSMFLSISSINAVAFSDNNNSADVQNYINSGPDNEIVLEGTFTNLSELNITRSLTIKGGSQNSIQGSGSGNLFNIRSNDIVFINLNISGYNKAINSAYIGYSNSLNNITITNNTITTTGYAIELHSDRDLSNINIAGNNIISSGGNGIHLNGGRGSSYSGNNENITIVNNDINVSGESIHLSTEFGQNINVNIINNIIRSSGWQTIYLGSGRWDKNGVNTNICISNNYINCSNGPGIHLNPFNGINNNITINNNSINSNQEGIFAGYGPATDIRITNNNITSLSNSGVSLNTYAGSTANNLTNIFIINNTISSALNGIVAYSNGTQRNINISRNNIINQNFTGIVLNSNSTDYSTNITIDSNNITSLGAINYAEAGIRLVLNSNDLKITNNRIDSEAIGISFATNDGYYDPNLKIRNNTVIANNIINSNAVGIQSVYDTVIQYMNISNNDIKSNDASINLQGNMTNLNIFNNSLYANSTTNTHRHTITITCAYNGDNDNINIFNNNITNAIGNGIYSSNGNHTNLKIYDNNIVVNYSSVTGYQGISINNYQDSIITIFRNNISTSVGVGVLATGNSTINITSNNISSYYQGIVLQDIWNGGNIADVSIINNNISSSNGAGIGIHTFNGGNISNVTILGNNILTAADGVYIGSSENINDLNISYNRILADGPAVNLNTSIGSNKNVYANWLGINNFNIADEFINVVPLSYYVANATLVKSKSVVGDNWTINYTFYLNGTNDTGDYNLLPYFLGQLYNESSDLWLNFLAKQSQLLKIPINEVTVQNLTIVVDDQILRLGLVESEKGSSNITMVIEGNRYGQTAIVNGKLTDGFGNVLANKNIMFFVNGINVANATTDVYGDVEFNYTYMNTGDFKFELKFTGDESYNGSSVNKIVNVAKVATNVDLIVVDKGNGFELIAKLTGDSSTLSGKIIRFYLNGELIGTGVTDSNGVARLFYSTNKSGIFEFTALFEGNNIYSSSSDSVVVSRENLSNNTTINSINSTGVFAGMKKTGVHVIILLIFLAALPFVSRKKDN